LQLNGHVTVVDLRVSFVAGVWVAALLASGCQSSSPLMPTGTSIPLTQVTVRTVARGSEAPLPGVAISVDHRFNGLTHADGTFTVQVDLGRWVRIDASSDEYGSFGAEGEINGPERWTFYLEPVTASPAR
jgi:hypothetical protein